jgi:hypothetical protein
LQAPALQTMLQQLAFVVQAAPVAEHMLAVHTPETQVCPAAQALAQAPQLAGSVERFAQPVMQAVWPTPHTQAPAVQVPAPQE